MGKSIVPYNPPLEPITEIGIFTATFLTTAQWHNVSRHEEHVRTQGSPQKAEFIAG
jgi:hypothetical protein